MLWLAWLAKENEDTATECRVAKACEFAASSFMSAFVRSINRRIGAKPEPARGTPDH